MYKNILITGGQGYIGRHIIKRLKKTFGDKVRLISVDNLENSYLSQTDEFVFEDVDINNCQGLENIFSKYKIDCVIHLAALADARESQTEPFRYIKTNIGGIINVLDCIRKYKIKRLIFASSCSVYGNTFGLISENITPAPISVYGESKLICENIIQDCNDELCLKSTVLRLFNVAGADSEGKIGENSRKITRIFTKVCDSVSGNKPFRIYGNKHATRDGTCERDYIHVDDVAEIFEIAILNSDKQTKMYDVFNIGSGNVFSNLEIVKEIEKMTKTDINIIYVDGNNADPDSVVSNINKVDKVFRWKPTRSSLANIINTSWGWFSRN